MKLIVKRKLRDYESWKNMVSTMDGLRKQSGSRGMNVYRSASDPNEVFMVIDWDDDKPYKDYINLPSVKEAFAQTGSFEITEIREFFHLEE